MVIDWNKPVETDERNPRPVRVLCTDRPYAGAPIVVMREDDGAVLVSDHSGRCGPYGDVRVRNVPPKMIKRMGVVGIRRNRHGEMIADMIGPEKHCEYIATSVVEWEEESPF